MTQDILMSVDEPVPVTNDTGRKQLQQFCLLAKTAHGAAILELIKQVLEAPGVYVFGELLMMPNIQELKDGENAKYYNTLHLFAYGTYKQYRQKPEDFMELTAAMQKKLQHLTIVSLAIKTKCIPYDMLLEELEIDNVRHLEDVIIEAIYADIIHGKLFQNTRLLEIDYAQGRDIPPGFTAKIAETLQEWVDSCDAISNCIVKQIQHANAEKSKKLENKKQVELKINNLKKVFKSQNDNDEAMQIDSRESSSSTSQEATRKKSSKVKPSRSAV